MRRQNLFALCGTADPWLSRACRATTLPRGTLRDSRSFARARAARSLRMTAPRGFGRRRREGDFSPPEASEPVILSAAGAKDLLSAVPDARPQQNRRSRAVRDSRSFARTRVPCDDRTSSHSAGQQILGSRPCPALRQNPLRTLRDSRSFARARAARSLRMTAPRGFGRRRREGDFSPPEASEPVILSAAGAKDLLSAVPDARPQQNRRSRAVRDSRSFARTRVPCD